jgi:hypothetical protein
MKTYGLYLGVLLVSITTMSQATTWTCAITNYPQAFKVVKNPVPSEFDVIVKISAPEICAALNRTCPYNVAGQTLPTGEISAVASQYASGVEFTHDGAGMKLYAARVSRQTGRVERGPSWYFDYGQCRQE